MAHPMTTLWAAYQEAVAAGLISGLGDLGVPGIPKRARAGLTASGSALSPEDQRALEKLLARWTSATPGKGRKMNDDNNEKKLLELGAIFLDAAEAGQADTVEAIINDGFPVNFQHPVTKETALHRAAASGARRAAEILAETEGCDFLIRDARGKLAWNNAAFFSRSPELEAKLLEKTKAQAAREGASLKEEHAAHLRRWFSEPWYNELAADEDYTPSP